MGSHVHASADASAPGRTNASGYLLVASFRAIGRARARERAWRNDPCGCAYVALWTPHSP
eukprot:272327-Pleurochrysis_carterae.AAC.1